LVLAGLIALYALGAARLEYLMITGPIVFVVLGFVLGPELVSVVDASVGSEIVRVVTGVTLAMLLFSDASSVNLRALRRDASVLVLLLFVALPLAVVFGAMAAWVLLPALGLATCALLASLLAPTDLSLGLAMFRNPRVPDRVRRTINVESGLNDGVATPVVMLFIGLVVAESEHDAHQFVLAIEEMAIGVGIGVVIGVAAGLLLRFSARRKWSTAASRQFAALAFALLAYGGGLALEGNGFIAAFVAGITFGAVSHEVATEAVEYVERTGVLLTLAVWFIFGAAIAPILLKDGLGWQPIVYALLSLTVVRMLAVALALVSKRLHWSTVLFVGWFGPRGLASVAFLILALQSLSEAGIETTLLAATAGWTILLSVILHGISAGPVAAWYSAKAAGFAPGSPELEPTTVVQTRHGIASPTSCPTTAAGGITD
jgi:NhaP-type Na+/H+ or K+/H+ antiporter